MLDSSTETITGIELAVKDRATVATSGERLVEPIEGVALHHPRTQADERGTLCEIYDERWGFSADGVPFVRSITVPPGHVDGWSVHLEQEDRLFFEAGTLRLSLYDGRIASPTFGHVNVLHLGAHDRALVRIPAGVYHAIRNVGDEPGMVVSLPTRTWDYEHPDEYRLAPDTDAIPHRA